MTPYQCLCNPPLIRSLRGVDVTQIWYAEDASGCEGLADIHKRFDCLCQSGPDFSCFFNAGKFYLDMAQY